MIPTLFAISTILMVLLQLAWLVLSQPHCLFGLYTEAVTKGYAARLPDLELDERRTDSGTPYAPLLRLELISNGHVRQAISQYFDQHMSKDHIAAVSITSVNRIVSYRSMAAILPVVLAALFFEGVAWFMGFMFAPLICNCSVTISGVASLAAISAGFGLSCSFRC